MHLRVRKFNNRFIAWLGNADSVQAAIEKGVSGDTVDEAIGFLVRTKMHTPPGEVWADEHDFRPDVELAEDNLYTEEEKRYASSSLAEGGGGAR